MARFYPPGGGSSASGGSNIDLDQITAPRRLVASGYKTITSDSIGEIVEGTLDKLGSTAFYDGSDESPDAPNLSKIYAASHTAQVGSFDFKLYGYFDDGDSGSTKVQIPNCTPANIAAGVKVGSTDQYLTGEYTNDATAIASDLKLNATMYAKGVKIVGTMPVNNALNSSINAGESVEITAGYYPAGKITANSLSSQTVGTAVASDIKNTKTAWVNGVLVSGSMAINTAINRTINAGDIVTIPEGYYLASKVTASSLASQTAGTAIASDIKDGKTAWINGVLITGDMAINPIVTKSINCGESASISEGYILGATITANSLASQTAGTATPTDLLASETAWVNGKKIEGTIPVRTAINTTLNAGGSINIPEGYYPASVVKATALSLQTVGTAIASDMKKDKTAWVNGILVTGTMAVYNAINTTLNAGGSIEIPTGYYPASKVTAKSLADQTAGTATDAHILSGDTAWVNGVLVTGTMPNIQAIDPAKSFVFPSTPANNTYFYARISNGAHITDASSGYPEVQIPQAMVASAANITADKLKVGETICGIEGTFTSDATATPDHIDIGRTAYVNGEKIIGTALLYDRVLDYSLSSVFRNFVSSQDEQVQTYSVSSTIPATKFVVSKTPPSDSITEENNGLIDLTLLGTGAILSWYETTNVSGQHECIQYIWSKYETVFVLNAQRLFSTYIECKSIDMSLFDFKYCWDFGQMFDGCRSLTSLDLSTMVTPSGDVSRPVYKHTFALDYREMFSGCTSLTNINYGDNFNLIDHFSTEMIYIGYNPTYHMFNNCPANKPANSNWTIGVWDNSGPDMGTYHIPTYLASGSVVNAALNKSAAEIYIYNPLEYPVIEAIPESAVDISKDQDRSILTWYDDSDSPGVIKQIIYQESDKVMLNPDCWELFKECANISYLDLAMVDSRNVTNMVDMFSTCTKLTELDLSGFDTSNVEVMAAMFNNCSSLTELDLSGFDTSKVTNMGSMFNYCTKLTSIDLSGFDTLKVENMAAMFNNCSSLTELDLSGFDTSNVELMPSMFTNCSKLTSLDLSSFNTEKVIAMPNMFDRCSELQTINLSSFNTSNVTSMGSMFSRCASLTSLDVSGFDTSKVTSMTSMFDQTKCTITYGNNFILSDDKFQDCISDNFTNSTRYMFYNSTSNKPTGGNWDLGIWNSGGTFIKAVVLTIGPDINAAINKEATSFVRSASAPDESITTTDISNIGNNSVVTWYDTPTTTQYWYSADDKVYLNANSSNMFNNCTKLTSIDLSGFDTSNVEVMASMFYNCSALTSLDLSHFDTSKVTYMVYIFSNCSSLTELNISSFNTSKVEYMNNMFHNCSSLTSLDVSKFNTSNVTNMSYMFNGCSKLTSLDVSKFNTSNVTDMGYMFNGCSLLELLDIRGFNTSKVRNMSYMFSSCSKLTTLDVSNFTTSNVINMSYMFYDCASLTTVDLSNFDTSNVADMRYMFKNTKCTITYSEKFVMSDSIYDTAILDYSTSRAYQMFYNSTSNKPTGGNWDLGFWTTTNGSFVKGVVLTVGPNIRDAINKEATSFVRSAVAPGESITTKDISNIGNNSAVMWYDTASKTQYWYSADTKVYLNTESSSMFGGCASLTSIDLSGFDTSNVEIMATMFNQCSSLTSLDLSNFDTSKVEIMLDMFGKCSSLTELNISGFNTEEVVVMRDMFSGCTSLTELDLSSFNTSKVVFMANMFKNTKCTITYGDNFVLSDEMFQECNSDNYSNPAKFMFSGSTSNKPTGGNWDLGIWDSDGSFVKATFLANGSTVNDAINKEATSFARSATAPADSVTTTDISLNNDSSILTWYDASTATQYYYSTSRNIVMNQTSTNVFKDCTKMTSIDISNFDTSRVTSMDNMFFGCNALTSLDVSSFNTSNVTNMGGMFYKCSKLTELNLSNFNTSNVVYMTGVFNECNNLTSLNVSKFDTSKVTNMSSMFRKCSSLTSLNISNFNTEKVTNMRSMFNCCSALTSLDLSNFNTPNITSTAWMFLECKANITYGSKFVMSDTIYNSTNVNNDTNLTYGMFYNSTSNKPTGGNWDRGNWDSTGTFLSVAYLATGEEISTNAFKDSLDATSVVRSYTEPAASDTTIRDISRDKDKSIICWFDNVSKTRYYYSKAPTIMMNPDSSMLFSTTPLATSIDLTGWNSSKVTDMHQMFILCASLTSLDLSSLDVSNVTDMWGMFNSCSALTSLNLSNWNTSKVTDMCSMFNGCESLTSLDLSHFDTSNVIDMSDMFGECTKITNIVCPFNTHIVVNMSTMFNNCSSLVSLDLSHFDTSNVTNMVYMFGGCSKLTSLDLSNFNTSNVTNMKCMFQDTLSAESITYGEKFIMNEAMLSECLFTDGSNPTFNMFNNTSLNNTNYPTGGNWDYGSWNETGTFLSVTYLATGATINAAINKEATSFVRSTVAPAASVTTVDISSSGDTPVVTWYDASTTTQYYYSTVYNFVMNSNSMSMFKNCTKMTSIDISNFDTTNVTNMHSMFYGCNVLVSIDVGGFDTSNVMNMGYMFNDCSSLTSLDLSNWNTSNVTLVDYMFNGCNKLTSLKISNWNTSKITNMDSMFHNCSSLTTLDVSNFNTSSVTNMMKMFGGCSKLTSLDVSSFDTSKVRNMRSMFNSCLRLTSLNLSNFDTSNVDSMIWMFVGCSVLTTITYGSNFVMNDTIYNSTTVNSEENLTYGMFTNSTSNKPTGGNWNNGTWANNGTFMKS